MNLLQSLKADLTFELPWSNKTVIMFPVSLVRLLASTSLDFFHFNLKQFGSGELQESKSIVEEKDRVAFDYLCVCECVSVCVCVCVCVKTNLAAEKGGDLTVYMSV